MLGYNARLRREHEQQAARGAYRGGRARGARGRGRGRGYFAGYQPYARPNFQDYTATFNEPARPSKAVGTISVTNTHDTPTESVQLEQERPEAPTTPCPQFTSTGKKRRLPSPGSTQSFLLLYCLGLTYIQVSAHHHPDDVLMSTTPIRRRFARPISSKAHVRRETLARCLTYRPRTDPHIAFTSRIIIATRMTADMPMSTSTKPLQCARRLHG